MLPSAIESSAIAPVSLSATPALPLRGRENATTGLGCVLW